MRATEEFRLKQGYSLRLVLPFIILLLIISTIGLIQVVNYHYSDIGLGQMGRVLMKKASQNAMHQAENLLEDAIAAVRLQSDLLSAEDAEDFDRTFNFISLSMMRFYPQFRTIYYGDAQGRHWSSLHEANGTITTRNISPSATGPKNHWIYRDQKDQVIRRVDGPHLPFDPRQRPWYQGALAAKATHWTDVYSWHEADADGDGRLQLGITVAQPVGDPANPKGVSGIDLTLSGLGDFLAKVELGRRGSIFILDAQGQLLLPMPRVDQSAGKVRAAAHEGAQKYLASESVMEAIRILGQVQDPKHFSFELEGETWLGRLETLRQPQGLGWRFGVVVPEYDFSEPVRQALHWSLFGALVLTGLAALVGLYIARSVTLPLALLSEKAMRLSRLDFLSTRPAISRFGEIRQLGSSFDLMTSGLRSFEKYVPTDLVKLLLAENREADLTAERRELSLLFADISGFTSLCEHLEQERLLKLMSEYFGAMTWVIRNGHAGVIDKFIGDAIMAFWNAPRDQINHAHLACLAALDCQRELSRLRPEWQHQGLPEIRVRIGINTGEVLVGNMGAVDRINYTAIGDPVNLASRLESLCKDYQVDIMISEFTRRAAGLAAGDGPRPESALVTRLLDAVVVRGKSQAVFVYELLPALKDQSADSRTFLGHYQQGIAAFGRADWALALDCFERARQESAGGKDPATKIFIARCRRKLGDPGREFNVPFAKWRQEILG